MASEGCLQRLDQSDHGAIEWRQDAFRPTGINDGSVYDVNLGSTPPFNILKHGTLGLWSQPLEQSGDGGPALFEA